ncbi:uncharacterized protein LOC134197769 [Corticium candelabrum]|uniref:uncharacterized protein LOC134197769 n=1 Tax=Corticium candelabrum TaxID=121492 RepID=UPI002E2552C0|nr:uncharacterized protein LOC134197769 [Corticium candelabrum]
MLAAACNCDAAGSTSSLCSSTGYCDCKTNVEDKQCDQCLTGFFNLQATSVDGCEDCECDLNGSDPSFNGACNSTGYCNCKPNVFGKKCDQCEAGFYLLAGSNGCIECGCSLSTAKSLQCHMQTGQCPCKSGLTGRTCGIIGDFHWLPFLEGIIYEAESAWLSGGAIVERRVSDLSKFTGTGGVRMSGDGNRITFRVTVPQRSIQYRLIIRYEAPSSFDSVVLTAVRTGDEASVLTAKSILPSAPTFANPHERPLMGQQIAGSQLIVNFTYNLHAGAGNPIDGFFVDSLLLMPVHTDLPEFQALSFGDQLVFPFTCFDVRKSVPQSSSASLTEFCRNITILINAALFNGALNCSCDNIGTLGSSQECEKLGGQCTCASNIVTRTCPACDYTYFGFDSAGCEACVCNVIGSNSGQCNETGYCDCKGNAGGQRCDICKSTFFNFSSSNSDVCEYCLCNVTGSETSAGGSCNATTGQCTCKANVKGLKCDTCKTGFFNLQASDVDGCEPCNCNVDGSTAASMGACNDGGHCDCKANVVGLKCDTCQHEFFLTGNNVANGCQPCGCSLSSAISLSCNQLTGQCPCKSGLTGRTCGIIEDLHWLPFLEGLIYEAESAWLSGGAMVERRVSDLSKFTGTGGVRMSGDGNRITFRVTVPQRSIQYRLIIRYEAPSSFDSVVLTAVRSGDGASVLTAEDILPSAPTFANPHERQLMGQQIAGSQLIVNFTYNLNAGAGNPIDGFFVDSLLLMPVHTDLPEFQALSFGDQLVFPFTCNDVRESVPQSSSASLTEFCRNITILINAALFNGALNCSCDNIGTLGSSQECEKLGGQCTCASNIVTRTCPACDYTYFGFDSAGCEACVCNVIGSNSGQCNETGYCDCKGNAGGQRCDICKSTFFNFSSSNSDVCEACMCNVIGSNSSQCNETGYCDCKGNVGGQRCDVCKSQFFNFTSSNSDICEGPPQKCNVVSTQSYDGQSMNVAVSCPENGNSPITAYRIEYRLDGNGMTWKSREFDATILQPFVIDGLEPFESYNFRATARNKYGYEAGELSFNNVVTNTTAEDYPGPPSIVSSSQNASRWLVVSWSLPDQPKGDPKYYFVYYQRVGLRQMRDTKRLNVTGTSVNLTMLSPFTWYSVEVAAVNVRSHDGKALEGQRSVARNFGTDEDAPTTAPRDVTFTTDPPHTVNVSWREPTTPNGIVRYYIVEYMLADESGTKTVLNRVKGLSQVISNLLESTYYDVTVQAYTIGVGPAASIRVAAHAMTPTPPQHVRNSSVMSSLVTIQWDSPVNSNGILLFYTVYYSTDALQYDSSPDIFISRTTYTLMNLSPYTTYFIYMSVTNNANFNSESLPSNVIQVQTLWSPPLKPDKPLTGDTRPSATTITVVPPSVDDSNGPIKYVDFVVHEDVTGSVGDEAANIPPVIKPYDKSRIWYVAARYEYDQYKKNIGGRQFIIGNGSVVSAGGIEYTNGPLQPGQSYLVYIRVIGIGDDGMQEFSSVSKATRYTTASAENESENESSSGGSSNSVLIIAVAVTLSVIILVLIIVVFALLRKNRCAIYRNEMKSETGTYDSVITNEATSGTSERLEASNAIMTFNSLYAATGADSGAESTAYEEVGITAVAA